MEHTDITTLQQNFDSFVQIDESLSLRRSTRTHRLPNYLKEFHCNLLTHSAVDKSTHPYYFGDYLSYDVFTPSYRIYILNHY